MYDKRRKEFLVAIFEQKCGSKHSLMAFICTLHITMISATYYNIMISQK